MVGRAPAPSATELLPSFRERTSWISFFMVDGESGRIPDRSLDIFGTPQHLLIIMIGSVFFIKPKRDL